MTQQSNKMSAKAAIALACSAHRVEMSEKQIEVMARLMEQFYRQGFDDGRRAVTGGGPRVEIA